MTRGGERRGSLEEVQISGSRILELVVIINLFLLLRGVSVQVAHNTLIHDEAKEMEDRDRNQQ